MFTMHPNGKGSYWVTDHAVILIETGMSGGVVQAEGLVQPYVGLIFDSRSNAQLYRCVGANWSRVRGELESWYHMRLKGGMTAEEWGE